MIAPSNLLSSLDVYLSSEIQLETIKYNTVDHNPLGSKKEIDGFRSRMFNYISKMMWYMYAKNKRVNCTAFFQRKNFFNSFRNKSNLNRILGSTSMVYLYLADYVKLLRILAQKAYKIFSPAMVHQHIFNKYNPDLVVISSFGRDEDGLFMLEAKKNGVPVVAVNQSWDKTCTKGYPTSFPDYSIVWSNIMKSEAEDYLDYDTNRIFVEGTPAWDRWFTDNPTITRDTFCKKHGFNTDWPIVYVSLSSQAYHKGNMNLIRDLLEARINGGFAKEINLYFRLHPFYFNSPKLMDELINYYNCFECKKKFVSFQIPDVKVFDGHTLVNKQDQENLLNILTFASVSVSVISSQMIESAIFKLPVINVKYGRWKTNLIDEEISNLNLEHLRRIFSVANFVDAYSPIELINSVNFCLKNNNQHMLNNDELINQEIPVNRGTATNAVASRLIELASRC